MLHVGRSAADDGDISEQVILADNELVEFHQFQDGEEGDDDFRLGGGGLEQGVEGERLAGFEVIEQEFDFVCDGETVINDIAEIVGFLEAFENVLEGADEIEDRDFRKSRRFFGGFVAWIGLMGETALLIDFAKGEETCCVLEFLVFDELANEFPARVVVFNIFLGRLFGAREKGSGFDVHQVGRHHNELGSEVDVEELESIDVIEVLLGDLLDRNGVDVQLVLFDQVEQEIERAFEDFELDFVIGVFQGTGERF